METTKNQVKSQAFVLNSKEVEKLYSLFPPNADATIEIACKDGIDRKYRSLEEFLSFEHPPNKQITQLTFKFQAKGLENSTS